MSWEVAWGELWLGGHEFTSLTENLYQLVLSFSAGDDKNQYALYVCTTWNYYILRASAMEMC